MAYTSVQEVEVAAGGHQALIDLSDQGRTGEVNKLVVEQAQREADAWIDSHARRLYKVPFDPVPDFIRGLAAAETVYRLKQYARVVDEQDSDARDQRNKDLSDLELGRLNPVDVDPYPIGDGGGTPIAARRSYSTDPLTVTVWSLRGYW